MSLVKIMLWRYLELQFCNEDVLGGCTAVEMSWVTVLLLRCLWKKYCYGDDLCYSISMAIPLATFLLLMCMTTWRQLGENFGILLWSKNVHFLPWQGMIDFRVHTNSPLQWGSWGLKVVRDEVLEAVELRLCLLPFLTPKNNHWSGCYITAKAITNVRETIRLCSFCHVT